MTTRQRPLALALCLAIFVLLLMLLPRERAVAAEKIPVRRLPSGAGHDGMAMQAIADIAMLFVRCKGGVSHNPAEAISEADAAAGARVLLNFIRNFSDEKRISA